MADSLTLRLEVSSDLVRPDAPLEAAVVYRKWGGSPDEAVGASAKITDTGVTLQVRAPDAAAYTTLPEQLGGPYQFAVGYIVARQDGEVVATARSYRVVWFSGPFPTESFGAAAAKMPQMSAGELKHTLGELARIPEGVSLAFAGGNTRSLVGFSPVSAEDVDVPLDSERSLKWPPEVF